MLTRPWWRTAVLGVLALVAVLAAVAVAVVAVPLADYPGSPDQAAVAPTATTPVLARSTDLARPVEVALTWTAPRSVSAHSLSGRLVTAVLARPKRLVHCGDPVLEVDGRRVAALCGARPPWRPVDATTKGPDRHQLIRMLRLRGLLATGKPSNTAFARAVRAWQRTTGQRVTGAVDPGDTVWIRTPVTPATVLVRPGDEVRPGLPLFGGSPALASARLTGAASASQGPRVFAPDAGEGSGSSAAPVTVPVDARGALRDLPILARALPAGTPRTVRGLVRLARPVDVFAVPASAVVSAGSVTCVVAAGRPTAVRVVDTDVDGVLVAGALTAGTAVLTAPRADATCSGP